MTETGFFNYSLSDTIAHVRLNRPPVNALGRQLIADLHSFAEKLALEVETGAVDVRALILSAEGKHFCAGADLKERQGMPEDEVERVVTATREMTSAMAAIPVPVIAAVHGSALGGGMELALAADLRILGESAKMGLRETALAIIPGAGGTQRLPRLIGLSRALYWMTTAKVFSAQECLRDGVANMVVPDGELLDTAFAVAKEIAANGPLAVRAAKEAAVRGLEVPLEVGLQIERRCYARIIPTADRLEALAAFQEKRAPKFQGK